MCANRLGSGHREACDHHFFDLFIFFKWRLCTQFYATTKKKFRDRPIHVYTTLTPDYQLTPDSDVFHIKRKKKAVAIVEKIVFQCFSSRCALRQFMPSSTFPSHNT